jgi:hypothetical protein
MQFIEDFFIVWRAAKGPKTPIWAVTNLLLRHIHG